MQANVISYDYSGYGLAEGEPSEKNMYAGRETPRQPLGRGALRCTDLLPTSADVAAVFQFIEEKLEIDPRDVVLCVPVPRGNNVLCRIGPYIAGSQHRLHSN